MCERQGIFAGDEPVTIIRRWIEEAAAVEPNDPNAIALATVDEAGMPNVRIVLLKEVEDDGFVFYTNYDSKKGVELSEGGKAAFVLHSKMLGRQIRVRGKVEREDGAKADAYYASRPLGSRIGAWASRQSAPLGSKEQLVAAVEAAQELHGADPARPGFWGGFRIIPEEIELWANGAFRLHDRFRWVKSGPDRNWDVTRLNP